MRFFLVSVISTSALLLLALLLYLTLRTGPVEARLGLNETCTFANFTGKCEWRDSCLNNLTSIKLEPCNEDDRSLICCPITQQEMTVPNNLVLTDLKPISNRPKRTPGKMAEEMCKIYGESAYRLIRNPSFFGPDFIRILDCKVGETLIIGGTAAEENEFPHMAMIGVFEAVNYGQLNWVCGGSIVSPEFILTAAHCNVTMENGYVMVGTNKAFPTDNDTNAFLEKHVMSISEVHIHPHYNAATNDNDLALIKLSTPLSENLRPICLDTENSISTGMEVIATGFGYTEAQQPSDVLLKVGLKTVEESFCSTQYKQINRALPKYPVCAYGKGNDTCRGDSGGPLQIKKGKQLPCMYTLIGVTSFGMKCNTETTMPGVYTKVYPYLEWIEDIVWPA